MSMGFMIAAASRRGDENRMDDREMRRRDSRGRYMEGNDHSTYMEHDEPEMRRRRDSRGRYMEDEDGPRMAYEGNQGRNESEYRPWPEPHIPPYIDKPEGNMRNRNVINIRDYQDKRRIGFGEDRMMNDEYEGNQHHKYGHSDYKHDKMDQHTAERWVDEMEGSDPANPMGGKWTPEQVKPYAQKYGFPTEGDKFWEFYAVMNAMYSDAFDTAKEFNLVKPEFFASLAKGWINDKDAVPNKAKVYYECIVK